MGLNKKEVVYIPIQEFSNFKNEDDLINISDLIKTILKNKKIIIIVTSIITILGVIYALLATPVYKIKANIQTGKIIENKNNENKKYNKSCCNKNDTILKRSQFPNSFIS